MSISAEATQVASLLLNLTQPDTEAIRNAELLLKPILKNPNSIPALFEVLSARGTQPVAVRHVAALLLRKRIPGHYKNLPADYKVKLQADLLLLLAGETERMVRNGAIGVTSVICELQTPSGDNAAASGQVPWPELFQFISAATQDANPDARELAFLLLMEMTETVGAFLSMQFNQIAQLFHGSITNEQEQVKVKTAAVKALGGLMSFLADEPEVDIFCNLLPALLQYSLECQKRNDEDTVSVILDVFYDIALSTSTVVSNHTAAIVRFCLGCMSDQNFEMNIRDNASLVVATLSESKPKKFGKDTELLKLTLDTIFNLIENSDETGAGALFMSNPAWRDDDDDGAFDPEGDNATETSMAQGTLDMLACELPKKYIFKPVVEMCFSRFQSPNDNHRKAGIACLGVIAEGCAEPFREHLTEIMPIVLQAAGDSSAAVRECACFTLGQMSEHCQPEILGYSNQVLPIAFALLDDQSVAVQATSCYVLEMFCERLSPESVRPLLDSLVRKLAEMLANSNKRSVQEMTIAALAATAVAAEEEFAPYVEGVATLMGKLMSITDEKMFSLRGRALECMGHISIAVGKENFRPYFTQTMQCACEGLAFDSNDLHEFAYALFANMAKTMEDEFIPCLNELVPHLLEVLKQDDGLLERQAEVKGELGAFDDSDDEAEEGNYVINVRTALLEAKKGAITAIGEIGTHCGAAFFPFLDETIKLLQKAATNWHPLIKAEAAEAFPSMVTSIVAAQHGGSIEWTKGVITGPCPFSDNTATVTSVILKELVELLKDDDQETVGKACGGIERTLDLCGPFALAMVANDCLAATHALLTKSAPCQVLGDQDDYDDDDEHETFMVAVCDLVAAFGRVMGPHFVSYLPQFVPPICEFAKSSRPISDRSMAVGCLAELAHELGDGVKDYWRPVLLPAILAGLADEDHSIRRNAAYCAGACCEGLGDHIVGDYVQILQAVGQLFNIDPSSSDTAAAVVDNAAACVSRMIMASPSNVPIQQVLPVLLKALPLKNDFTENETVYKCVLGLLQLNNADALAQKEEIKRVFIAASAAESEVDDEIKQQLQLGLQALN